MGYELGTDGAKVIVVGVDGSPTSLRAASFALGMARREGAKLTCVYVAQLRVGTGQDPNLVLACEQTNDEIVAGLQRELSSAQARTGTPVSLVVRRGDPSREIGKYADGVKADLIVVGRSVKPVHERVGSTGGKLVRAGRWPVTIVP